MRCDAVFEGGGVKGLAFIGGIQETEKRGYKFHRIAGTSAGAIFGSLLAAGYNGKQLESIMEDLPFPLFTQNKGWGNIPVIGRGLNLLLKNGMYSLDAFEKWLSAALSRKGVKTFGDLAEDRLKIIASDLSNGRLLILPDDLQAYGVDKERFPVSKAVQMSITIPYYFQPYLLGRKEKSVIVDGGLLSNYPIWIFDSKQPPRWPTFGYRLRGAKSSPTLIKGPISLFMAIFTTMMEAHDRKHVKEQDAVRTIFLPVDHVKSTDFYLRHDCKKHLVELGRQEAKQFFDQWDFIQYIEKYRSPNSKQL